MRRGQVLDIGMIVMHHLLGLPTVFGCPFLHVPALEGDLLQALEPRASVRPRQVRLASLPYAEFDGFNVAQVDGADDTFDRAKFKIPLAAEVEYAVCAEERGAFIEDLATCA